MGDIADPFNPLSTWAWGWFRRVRKRARKRRCPTCGELIPEDEDECPVCTYLELCEEIRQKKQT